MSHAKASNSDSVSNILSASFDFTLWSCLDKMHFYGSIDHCLWHVVSLPVLFYGYIVKDAACTSANDLSQRSLSVTCRCFRFRLCKRHAVPLFGFASISCLDTTGCYSSMDFCHWHELSLPVLVYALFMNDAACTSVPEFSYELKKSERYMQWLPTLAL